MAKFGRPREMHKTISTEIGKESKIPFKPVEKRIITLAQEIFGHLTIIEHNLSNITVTKRYKHIILVRDFCKELEQAEAMIFRKIKSESFYKKELHKLLKEAKILEKEFISDAKQLKKDIKKNIGAETALGVSVNATVKIIAELDAIRRLLKAEEKII